MLYYHIYETYHNGLKKLAMNWKSCIFMEKKRKKSNQEACLLYKLSYYFHVCDYECFAVLYGTYMDVCMESVSLKTKLLKQLKCVLRLWVSQFKKYMSYLKIRIL